METVLKNEILKLCGTGTVKRSAGGYRLDNGRLHMTMTTRTDAPMSTYYEFTIKNGRKCVYRIWSYVPSNSALTAARANTYQRDLVAIHGAMMARAAQIKNTK